MNRKIMSWNNLRKFRPSDPKYKFSTRHLQDINVLEKTKFYWGVYVYIAVESSFPKRGYKYPVKKWLSTRVDKLDIPEYCLKYFENKCTDIELKRIFYVVYVFMEYACTKINKRELVELGFLFDKLGIDYFLMYRIINDYADLISTLIVDKSMNTRAFYDLKKKHKGDINQVIRDCFVWLYKSAFPIASKKDVFHTGDMYMYIKEDLRKKFYKRFIVGSYMSETQRVSLEVYTTSEEKTKEMILTQEEIGSVSISGDVCSFIHNRNGTNIPYKTKQIKKLKKFLGV